jgi:hypothetical protein
VTVARKPAVPTGTPAQIEAAVQAALHAEQRRQDAIADRATAVRALVNLVGSQAAAGDLLGISQPMIAKILRRSPAEKTTTD